MGANDNTANVLSSTIRMLNWNTFRRGQPRIEKYLKTVIKEVAQIIEEGWRTSSDTWLRYLYVKKKEKSVCVSPVGRGGAKAVETDSLCWELERTF